VLSFLTDVGVLAAVYGILSVSLHLQAGVTGLLDFGLIGFFGIGAYATGIGAMHGLHWLLGMLCGVGVAVLAGAGVGRLGRTLSAEYWAIATLALAELIRLIALNTSSLTQGSQGITSVSAFFTVLGPTQSDRAWLGLTAAVFAVCLFTAHRVTSGQFGRTLRLVREVEDAAAVLGHDPIRAKVRVMAISAPMAALAGSLYTHYITFIGPDELQSFGTFLVFTMVIVGGMGNLWGVVVGSVLVELLYNVTRYLSDLGISPSAAAGLRIVVVGGALLGFLYFRPAGLIPERLRRVQESGKSRWRWVFRSFPGAPMPGVPTGGGVNADS
jgi:branched-chain amino acid transport system permease protein